MNKEFPFLLNIGYKKFILSSSVIAILSSEVLESNKNIFERENNIIIPSDCNNNIKSYIVCLDNYIIASPINSETLKRRYDNWEKQVNQPVLKKF